ncbi:acetyl-CoA carboxylase biotin carboxyl carrier protein [Lactiplantibacillus modestisalitolerans]|uniref:Biotin carboxyl carrier protein of acetyl-CoA carboxylase n=1 Tax=Lactiplantibacillus modestisalitolerans TaxID=1457219 RepID=A0ABV5WWK4_9LACO|nr:biotin/lipoyl-containing protein [Lactiplantibacillus modestisalitolerans]
MDATELKTMTTLIETFNASSAQVLTVKTADYELHLNKKDEPQPVSSALAAGKSAVTTKVPTAAAPTVAASATKVTAPLVGVAYLAPKPDQAPFVQVGTHVKRGQTVCVIEAMKLINEVPSPVSGTIKRIFVQNAAMVEYAEPLFEIEED